MVLDFYLKLTDCVFCYGSLLCVVDVYHILCGCIPLRRQHVNILYDIQKHHYVHLCPFPGKITYIQTIDVMHGKFVNIYAYK